MNKNYNATLYSFKTIFNLTEIKIPKLNGNWEMQKYNEIHVHVEESYL